MNETDDILTQAHYDAENHADFGTSDINEIRKILEKERNELKRLESSLGGFLYLFRERRRQTVPEISAQAKISIETWESWEGDVTIPTGEELKKLTENLGLSDIHASKILKLWHQSPFQSLCRMAQFRPQLLAARGLSVVDARSQWGLIHPDAQEKLERWAEQRDYDLPEQLLKLISELEFETDDGPENWAREVWNSYE